MGQNNSRRISHDVDLKQNTFRDDQLRQIIDDLEEESSGLGYSEIIRSGPFVSKIITWDRPTNNPSPDPDAIKRTETTFTRTGAFVDSILKEIYNEEGTAVIAKTDITFVRDASQRTVSANVVNTRL